MRSSPSVQGLAEERSDAPVEAGLDVSIDGLRSEVEVAYGSVRLFEVWRLDLEALGMIWPKKAEKRRAAEQSLHKGREGSEGEDGRRSGLVWP